MNASETVLDVLKELCGKEEIKETDSLLFDLGLDSLEMVALLVQLEQAMQIQLKESDMDPFNLSTVADVIKMAKGYEESSNEEGC